MAGPLRFRFFLCALVFMVGIGLIAAIKPVAPAAVQAAAVAPASRSVRHQSPGRVEHPWGMAQPGAWGPSAGVVPPGQARFREHEPRFRGQDPRFGPRFTRGAPTDDFTFDGWRLVGALALTGGVASLLWASLGEVGAARTSRPAPQRLERDLAALRGEIERLEREQRQLQMTVDWQARLLKHMSPGAAESALALAERRDDV